jgi:4-aminobutyrate aminotransferase/(S)-3-amino-2-methylpropionate transaminase
MMAIELVKDRETKEPATKETVQIIQECVKNGVLIAGAGINKNLLRMLVSLEITDEQLDEALDVLEKEVGKIY